MNAAATNSTAAGVARRALRDGNVVAQEEGVPRATAAPGPNIAPFKTGPRCDRCRFGRGRCSGRTAYKEHHRKLTPGDAKADPFVINDTALTGLSTLCPRRRSSTNQVAVVKGWITPTTNSADRRSDSRERRPSRNIAPFNRSGRFAENHLILLTCNAGRDAGPSSSNPGLSRKSDVRPTAAKRDARAVAGFQASRDATT